MAGVVAKTTIMGLIIPAFQPFGFGTSQELGHLAAPQLLGQAANDKYFQPLHDRACQAVWRVFHRHEFGTATIYTGQTILVSRNPGQRPSQVGAAGDLAHFLTYPELGDGHRLIQKVAQTPVMD